MQFAITVPRDSLIRAQAGVRHVLQELSGDGHCAAVHTSLVELSEKLIEIPATTIEEAIAAELTEENLVEEAIDERPCLFLTPLHRAEVGVAQRVHALLAAALGASGR